jgi:hypothetical protein
LAPCEENSKVRRAHAPRPSTFSDPGTGKVKGTRTSCRIQLCLEGMEWFLYNRTAAYDNILAQMEPLNRSSSRVSASERLRPAKSRQGQDPQSAVRQKFTLFIDATSTYPPSAAKRSVRIPSAVRNAFVWVRQQLPNLDPKDLLPLGIEVSTGSIVLGNPSTPSILVAEFRSAAGTFGVVSVSGLLHTSTIQTLRKPACSLDRSTTSTSNF